jgi:ribonuclease-3
MMHFLNEIASRFSISSDSAILLEAFTHRSYAVEHNLDYDNQRLEFLGDSVLSLVASVYLFKGNRNLFEGDLTKIRAGIVCENALYEYAMSLGLGEFLRLGHGEEATGGRKRKSVLSDAFEALLAAIYLDGGFSSARKFVLPYLAEASEKLMKSGGGEDYKTLLQKFVQQNKGDILEYVLVDESGPSHCKTFVYNVLLNNNVIGRGTGSSKRDAEQAAAKEALILFGKVTG